MAGPDSAKEEPAIIEKRKEIMVSGDIQVSLSKANTNRVCHYTSHEREKAGNKCTTNAQLEHGV